VPSRERLLGGGVAAGKRSSCSCTTGHVAHNETGKKIFDNAVAYALGSPAASFAASRSLGVVPWQFQFTDQSTGPVTSWTWDFGDWPDQHTAPIPAHTYTQTGTCKRLSDSRQPGRPTAGLSLLSYAWCSSTRPTWMATATWTRMISWSSRAAHPGRRRRMTAVRFASRPIWTRHRRGPVGPLGCSNRAA